MTENLKTSLGHDPGERWDFDESVTDVFDDMLDRSIPDYAVMRDLVTTLGAPFVVPGTSIVDLGCSRGGALVPFMSRFGAHNSYVGIDVSAPMLDAARERFAAWPPSVVSIVDHDLRRGFPAIATHNASLILSVLTLMFTPINYRPHLIQQAYDALVSGGAFMLVEKVIGETSIVDRVLNERYHAMKRDNGYTQEEVERKRLALEGVQVPMTAEANERMLRAAGFRAIECFWRHTVFAGWIAVK